MPNHNAEQDSSQKYQTCSQEAASSTITQDEQMEFEELAEYFERFVAVEGKMSQMAESMYV